MNKLSFVVGCVIFSTVGVSAQVQTVKDVEHALSAAKPDYEAALKAITPTLTNDETKDNPAAWFLAGKSAFGIWDKLVLTIQLGQSVKDEQKKHAAHAIIDAYDYLLRAMSLDSLPDAKGKVKPKYTKDIQKLLARNYRSYRNAGIFLYDLRDLAGAYDAWDIYVNMPRRLNVRKKIIQPDGNDELGQIYYYQAVCALTCNRNSEALDKFSKAQQTGFSNRELYLYGMEAARREANDSLMLEYATLGAKLYGKKEVSFTLYLINNSLRNEDYAGCRNLVDEALNVNVDDRIKSQLYDVLGVIDDHDGNFESALANFQKAVVYDDSNAKAYFDLARVIYNEALKLAESGEHDGEKRAAPGLVKAAEYFERAYGLDDRLSQIPETLYGIYYRLGAGYEEQTNYWQKVRQRLS